MRRNWCRRAAWESRSSAKSNSRRNFCLVRSSRSPGPTARRPPPRWPAKLSPLESSPQWSAEISARRLSAWWIRPGSRPGPCLKYLAFSWKKEIEKGAFARGAQIYFGDGHSEREIMPLPEVPLKGAHNLENVLAGVSIGMLVGCQPEQIRQAVRNFKAVEHRLEFVARFAGVDYYNDSKATNVDATIKALEAFPADIPPHLHLILGGKDKGSDYTLLHELLRQRVKRVYTIGAAAAKIEAQIQGAAEIDHAETLENAVRRASESAVAGDVILLAPACASFDQFQSYEHRGRVFKETVHSLAMSRST